MMTKRWRIMVYSVSLAAVVCFIPDYAFWFLKNYSHLDYRVIHK
jgi:hypothetical protein